MKIIQKLKQKRWLGILVCVVLLLSIGIPVLAAVLGSPSVVAIINTGMTAVGSHYGVSPEPYTNTFYTEGRHWVFYLDRVSSLRYASMEPGKSWKHYNIVFGTGLYTPEFSVWYDEPTNTVHYARHEPVADNVVYRMGTPNDNGTITWAGVAEEIVAPTPAALATWRTTIAVDEDHNPWVAWIDTNGVDAYGVVYVEASTTHNGTWTQNVAVSDVIDVVDWHAWFVQLCPIGTAPGNLMELIWSFEDQGVAPTGTALEARRYNTATGWTVTEHIAIAGEMAAIAPWAFDTYDIGTTVNCIYTQAATGDLMVRARTAAQTWATADGADMILDGAVIGYIPTLSGYRVNGASEDMICIYSQDATALGYMLHDAGDGIDVWGAPQHIWTVPVPIINYITRHNAAYQYGSPMDFTWQVTHLDGALDPEYDTVYYWWIDSDNNGLGYYVPASRGFWLLNMLLPIIIGIGVVLTAFGIAGKNPKVAMYGVVVGVGGFIIIQAILAAIP